MFDFTGVEAPSFGPVPAGDYPVIVSEAEFKSSNSGGEYLKLKLTIGEGKFMKRVIFTNINLIHSNPTAVQIGMQMVKGLLLSIGYKEEQLATLSKEQILSMIIGKAVTAKISVKKDLTYGDSNDVKAFSLYKKASTPTSFKTTPVTDFDIPF